ncbi:GNAT family N-acetyltransferase [Streptomyces sp. NPDC008159]|uniref:GNAT family N-acetyltransferase n=1 Tax=Streptomyces sp. NPDC008159 TaxID=3364817 RepID=UPI0036ECF973
MGAGPATGWLRSRSVGGQRGSQRSRVRQTPGPGGLLDTAAHARGRGVAPRAPEALTSCACDTFGADGLERLELLHQEDNLASCRVAQKIGHEFDRVLPAAPPSFPLDGRLRPLPWTDRLL